MCFNLCYHLSSKNVEDNIEIDQIQNSFYEINSKRLNISKSRYVELKKKCKGDSNILFELKEKGFDLYARDIENTIQKHIQSNL